MDPEYILHICFEAQFVVEPLTPAGIGRTIANARFTVWCISSLAGSIRPVYIGVIYLEFTPRLVAFKILKLRAMEVGAYTESKSTIMRMLQGKVVSNTHIDALQMPCHQLVCKTLY
jgi:hypothetical protein